MAGTLGLQNEWHIPGGTSKVLKFENWNLTENWFSGVAVRDQNNVILFPISVGIKNYL